MRCKNPAYNTPDPAQKTHSRVALQWAALPASFHIDRLRVVLVAARNPLNIGAAARAMSNFGFSTLRVVDPYDLAFREAKSAVGAADLLRKAEDCKTLADAVADCELVVGTTGARKRELDLPLVRLEQAAPKIRSALARGRVALLFGSEKTGLTNEQLAHCHWLLRIPTRDEHASMNLGQAVALCVYELVRDAKAKAPKEKLPAASSGELERLTSILLDALRTSGYVKQRTAVSTEAKVRRLVRRLRLSPVDAEVLLGMLRQILWKIERTD